MKKNIAVIIPARGGSKGIPKKNIASVGGKPLLWYSLEAYSSLLGTGNVYVSTDDQDIKALTLEYGACVVDRPADIAGDRSSSEEALMHVLSYMEKEKGLPDFFIFAQCTSPLIESGDIQKAIKLFIEHRADVVFSAVNDHGFLWEIDDKGNALSINHDSSKRLMRQELHPQYRETGSFYILDTKGFLEHKHRFFGKTMLCELDREKSLDIDDYADLEYASYILNQRKTKDLVSKLPKNIDAVIWDFDGVFTDNKVTVSEDKKESVVCNRSDGLGIGMLKENNIFTAIISKEKNKVVKARADKLNLDCFFGIDAKLTCLKELLQSKQVKAENVLYVGNDLNDIECIDYVGCGVAVADAFSEVKNKADIILAKKGGQGAVRELVDLILIHKKVNI